MRFRGLRGLQQGTLVPSPILVALESLLEYLVVTAFFEGRRRQSSAFESQADTDIKTKVGNVCSQSERFRPRNLLEHIHSLQHLPRSSCHAIYTHPLLQTPEHLARNRIIPIVK